MPPIDGFRASYLMRGYPDTEPGLKAACIVERARWHEPTSQPCTIRQDWRP